MVKSIKIGPKEVSSKCEILPFQPVFLRSELPGNRRWTRIRRRCWWPVRRWCRRKSPSALLASSVHQVADSLASDTISTIQTESLTVQPQSTIELASAKWTRTSVEGKVGRVVGQCFATPITWVHSTWFFPTFRTNARTMAEREKKTNVTIPISGFNLLLFLVIQFVLLHLFSFVLCFVINLILEHHQTHTQYDAMQQWNGNVHIVTESHDGMKMTMVERWNSGSGTITNNLASGK